MDIIAISCINSNKETGLYLRNSTIIKVIFHVSVAFIILLIRRRRKYYGYNSYQLYQF